MEIIAASNKLDFLTHFSNSVGLSPVKSVTLCADRDREYRTRKLQLFSNL